MLALLAALGPGLPSVPALASGPPQEPSDEPWATELRADTLQMDTVRVDTLPAEPAARVRLASRTERFRAFPGPLPDASGEALPTYRCDSACLLDAPWLTLAELVAELVPGVSPIRGGWFGGPHHLTHGLAGPGALRLVVDGRELTPLEGAQPDLLRVPLVHLGSVEVQRHAGGVVVEVTTRRHNAPTAYSRITGATAQPSGELLRGIFTNHWGRELTVGAVFDLQDIVDEGRENDRIDFGGRLAWMPTPEGLGVELDYHTQSATRRAADTLELTRRHILLRGRAPLTGDLRAEAVVGRTDYRAEEAELAEGEEALRRQVEEVGFSLGAVLGGTELSASARAYEGPGAPSTAFRLGFARGEMGPLAVQAEGSISSWPAFVAAEGRAAAALRLDPGFPVVLRAEGATGRRAVPRPAEETADSVSFDGAAGEAEIDLGVYRVRGRLAWDRTERTLPFGGPLDAETGPLPGLELTAWEVGASGPLIPLGAVVSGLSPVTAQGWWRQHEVRGIGPALHVPSQLAGLRLLFLDGFFQDNLEIRLAASLSYRGETPAARPGATEPVSLGAQTWWSGHFQFRIADFRFFWKWSNPAGLAIEETVGVPFPRQLNVFGIHWEFFN